MWNKSKKNTLTHLHEIISNCYRNIDKGLVNLLLFIDFKKAFDLINPELLIVKLLNYGFSNNAISLISSYFNNQLNIINKLNLNNALD